MQRCETSHFIIKNLTKKHTRIEVSVQKLQHVVIEMAGKYEDTINCQRQNTPLLVADKPSFKEIQCKIPHKALNLLLHEWIFAEKLVEDFTILNKPPPDIQHNSCKKECLLSIQLGLSDKFFYSIV